MPLLTELRAIHLSLHLLRLYQSFTEAEFSMLASRSVTSCGLILFAVASSAAQQRLGVAAFDRARVLKAANQYLSEKPFVYDDQWPMRQASLLFAGLALNRPDYIELWKTLPADSNVEEVIRNFFIRQPALWIAQSAIRIWKGVRPWSSHFSTGQ